jgi:hypothetical protein
VQRHTQSFFFTKNVCSGFGELGASLLSRKPRDFAADKASEGTGAAQLCDHFRGKRGQKRPTLGAKETYSAPSHSAECEGAEMFPYVYLFEGRVHVIKAARAHELKQDCSTLLHGAEFNISHFAQHVRGLS